MRRTATLSLEGFDPDVIEAAREVAQRAGVPLETWIESVVSPERPSAKPAASRQRTRVAAREPALITPPETKAREPAPAPITPPKPKAIKPAEPLPAVAPAQEPAAATIGEMMRRLDALDRSLHEERGVQRADAENDQSGRVAERLAEIERRMGDISAQIAVPRPLGRRGRPIATEMREAVDEVRARQRELDSAGSAREPAARSGSAAPSSATRSPISEMQRTREPAELASPIAMMRQQVESLAEEFADNVHARLAGEAEQLASRVDGTPPVAASGADRSALDGVHGELDQIREMIAGLAGPERIQSLAQGLQAVSGQIADLQAHVDVNPVRDLIGRLETIGETLHRPPAPGADLAAMHALLRGLAEKVDRVGSGGGNLDALESQVVSLAQRLDTHGADPAVASLERTMGELLTQIVSLRDETSVEAAVERATRKAIAETIGADGQGTASGWIDAFRSDLDDLRTRQISADQRMQATMDGLNAVLARLVDRLGMPETGPVVHAALSEDTASLGEQLRASTTLAVPKPETVPVSAPRSRIARRSEPALDASGLGDELLEPGAGRPPHARGAVTDASGASAASDIKTNFIAAARRAAQAAQADIAAEAPTAPEKRDAPRLRMPVAAEATPGLVSRLLGGIEKRRRPLVLGLAAVVLVLGALQAYQMNFAGSEASPSVSPLVGATPLPGAAAPTEASVAPAAPSVAVAPAAPVAGPQTTQALSEAGPPPPKPAAESLAPVAPVPVQPAIPRVASIGSLGRDLATVPTGLATLKDSALGGDGAAIYELAGREADGRGMPRDLALAARLYEKLAEAGYAPAQFKLGSFYEKGSGVIRDLAQARTWYGRAADHGNIRAMHNLAVLNAENPSATGKPDFAAASSWFRRAAEHGVRDSQYNLAVLYARGLGLGQDLIQSYAWFSAAAAQGDEEAGKKRDDVAAKLSPKDLAAAKAVASAYKPKVADPSANDQPQANAAAPPAVSLLTAPPPGSASAESFTRSAARTGV